MTQEKRPADWRVRDELQMGLDLYNGIKAKARRGEAPSEAEVSAFDEFQAELQLFAHSAGLPEDTNPFLDLFQDIQSDTQDWTGERERINAEFSASLGGFAPHAAAPGTRTQATAGAIIAPVNGLRRGEGPGAFDVTKITDRESERGTGYFFPRELLERPGFADESLYRRAMTLSGGSVNASIDADGNPSWVLNDGIETWDITEQMGLWNRPDVKERLRMSLTGAPPVPGGEILKGASTLTTLLELTDRGLAAVGLGDRPMRRGMRTAVPGDVVPWEVPLGLDGKWRGDEAEVYADPLHARALHETVFRMRLNGELDPTAAEAFAGTLIGLGDIALFQVGAGKVLGLAGKVAAASEFGARAMAMNAYAEASGLAASRMFAYPLNLHFSRTVGLLAAHGWFGNLANPETSWTEDAWHGAKAGAEIAAVGGAIKPLRAAATALASRLPWVEAVAGRLAPYVARGMDPTGMMMWTKDAASKMLAALRTLPSADKVFTKEFAKLALGGGTREAIMRSVDSYGVGMHLGARQWAEMQPGYEGLPISTKIGLYWRGLGSQIAQAAGAGFMLGGLAMSIPAQRKAVHEFLASEPGVRLMTNYARRLGLPEREPDVRESFQAFDAYREQERALFEGAVKMNPAAQKSWQAYEENLQAVRSIVGWHPMEDAPGRGELTSAGGAPEPTVTDALPKFRALLQEGEGILSRAAPEVRQPVYTVGEVTPEFLDSIGFGGRSVTGRYKHALNAVAEYQRAVDGVEASYERLADVPRALFERALDWRDRQKKLPMEVGQLSSGEEFRLGPVKRGARQMSLDEAGKAIESVEGNRAYAGKTPSQVATEVQAKKARRRESLGRAIALVLEGKRDAAWLRETYPEGAAAIGQGKAADWIGAFERGVRATWKERQTENLRKGNAIRADDALNLQSFVRKMGGVRYVGDLENLTRKEGVRGVVHSKASGKGMSIDNMAEAATEAGFFAERPAREADFIDALLENITHPSHSGLRATRDYARQQEVMHADQLLAERAAIEAGADLPGDPPARRALLFDVFSSDPRFAGMDPIAVEKEVLALRADTALGAPPPELAGPPDTAASLFTRAAAKTRRLVETLQWGGLLPMDVTAHDPIVAQAIVETSLAKPELAGPGVAKMGEAGWQGAVQQAKDVRALHRDAMLKHLGEHGEAQLVETVRDTFEAIDAKLEGRDLDPAVRERLRKTGRIDEHGLVKTRWEMLLSERASEQAFETERAARESAQAALPGFGSFVPPVALSGRTFTHVEESTAGKVITMQHWMDQPGVQRFLSGHPFARGLMNAAKKATGPLTGPIATAEREMMERALVKIGLRRAEAGWPQLRMQSALSRLFKAWNGARPPQGDIEFWDRLIQSGGMKNVRGPEDLERLRPGSGYMWPTMAEARDVLQEYGLDWVQAGWMPQEVLDTIGGGAYGKHVWIREQQDRDAADLGAGRLPVRYMGFLLPRQGHPSGASMRVKDPLIYMRQSAKAQGTLFRQLKTLEDFAGDASFWKTEGDIARMGEYEQSRYQRAAYRTTEADAAVEKYRPGFQPEAARLGAILSNLHSMMTEPGEAPSASKPLKHSEKVDRMLRFFLGETEKGPIFLPKPLAEELDLMMSELYVQAYDGPSLFGRGLRWLDQAGSWWKRGRTVLRYAHWTQQVISNALNNHGAARLPISDFVLGALGRPSFTRDGLQGFAKMARWISEGMPKERPQGWTEGDWNEAMAAKAFHDLAGGSSYALAGLSPEMAESFNLALDNHRVVREGLEREAKDRALAEGWSDNQLERVIRSAQEFSRQLQTGLEPIDEAMGQMIGSPDPVAHARSFGAATSLYLYMDLALFKYPAYLKAKHEFPDAEPAKLVAYSTAAAGDMRNTSPLLRRWLSMHTPYNASLWRATTPHAGVKVALSQLFRNRFWMWSNATGPVLMRAAVRHPLLGLTAAAIGGAGMRWLIHQGIGQDDETERMFDEEMRHARNGALYQFAIPKRDQEALNRVMHGYSRPDFAGGKLVPRDIATAMKSLWNRVAPAFVAQGPSRAGETRQYKLQDFAGPFGEAAKRAEGVTGLVNTLTADEWNPQRAAELMNFGERSLGFAGQLAVGAFMGGPDDVGDALGGKTSWGESFVKSLQAFGRMLPPAYPVLGLFSAEGQYLGENVATGGQRWNDYFAGIERAYRGETPAELGIDGVLNFVWPTRSVLQKPPLRSPTDAWSTLASAVLGESVDPQTERGRESLKAAGFVARQLSQTIKDLYEQHFDMRAKPETTEIELDDLVVGALRETWDHTVEVMPDVWELEPGYVPQGAVLRAISGGTPAERSARIKYLRRYTSQETFTEGALNALFEAGRRAEMGKGIFGEAVKRAMTDPGGTQLLGWWWSRIQAGDKDAMEQLAPLVFDTPIPAKGTEAYGYWRDIWSAYAREGMEFPVEMSDEDRRAIEGAAGAPLMLQGGRALQNELRGRSLLEGLK